MAMAASHESKYYSYVSFDGGLTSVNVPKKPNCLPSSRFLHCQRYFLPTRTYISRTGISQPSYPCHFCISSEFVWAAHTSWRAALNVRVTRTSRSLGNVTSAGILLLLGVVSAEARSENQRAPR